jgi:hypothetical protein
MALACCRCSIACDLLGAGQVRDARLDDLPDSRRDARRHLLRQFLGDPFGAVAQRELTLHPRVARVGGGDLTHGGLGLHRHGLHDVVHLESARAVSSTCHTTISIGLPSASFTFDTVVS